jgi:hypothetical protein
MTIRLLSNILRFDLERRLCEMFCSYYKPSKNSELSCRGMSVVGRLIEGGKNVTFEKSDKVYTESIKKFLLKHICAGCPFYEKDCDFIQYQGTSQPCGGFILLGQLLESGSITLEDIMRCIS